MPTLVRIGNDYECAIVSDILNLSRSKYGHIYKYIAQIFSKMVREFEWILKCELRNKTIQAIIEIQHYTLGGNTVLKGNFHREGLRYLETIAAGGIWYFEKSEGVFSTDRFEVQAKGYVVCGGRHSHTHSLAVSVNDNVTFNNNIVIHRLRELKNSTNKIGKRSHVLFLLPEYKIKSTHDIVTHGGTPINQYQHMEHVISHMIRSITDLNVRIIPNEIKQILSSYCYTNLQEMLQFRNKLRLMRVNVSGDNNILLASMN